MKKEHFEYITEHFNLSQYSPENNAASIWREEREGDMNVSDLEVMAISNNRYHIHTKKHRNSLFCYIPSRELAMEIIEHIKDTEILFL